MKEKELEALTYNLKGFVLKFSNYDGSPEMQEEMKKDTEALTKLHKNDVECFDKVMYAVQQYCLRKHQYMTQVSRHFEKLENQFFTDLAEGAYKDIEAMDEDSKERYFAQYKYPDSFDKEMGVPVPFKHFDGISVCEFISKQLHDEPK